MLLTAQQPPTLTALMRRVSRSSHPMLTVRLPALTDLRLDGKFSTLDDRTASEADLLHLQRLTLSGLQLEAMLLTLQRCTKAQTLHAMLDWPFYTSSAFSDGVRVEWTTLFTALGQIRSLRTLTLRRCRELNSLLPLVDQHLPWLGQFHLHLLRPLLKQLAEPKEHCIPFEDLLHDSTLRELLEQAPGLQV